MVQAIEQVLNTHNMHGGGALSSPGSAAGEEPLSSPGGTSVVTSHLTAPPLPFSGVSAAFSALAMGQSLQSSAFFPPSYMPPTLNSAGFKSAFSPISAPPTAHLNSIRYSYGNMPGAMQRGSSMAAAAAALSLPYPPLLPSLATMSSYHGYGGLGHSNKALHYALGCACCPSKPYSSPTSEKSAGCISD